MPEVTQPVETLSQDDLQIVVDRTGSTKIDLYIKGQKANETQLNFLWDQVLHQLENGLKAKVRTKDEEFEVTFVYWQGEVEISKHPKENRAYLGIKDQNGIAIAQTYVKFTPGDTIATDMQKQYLETNQLLESEVKNLHQKKGFMQASFSLLAEVLKRKGVQSIVGKIHYTNLQSALARVKTPVLGQDLFYAHTFFLEDHYLELTTNLTHTQSTPMDIQTILNRIQQVIES